MKKNDYSIIWEDEDLVVVNKAPGVLCIPGRFDTEEANVKAQLKKKYGDIWTVHRIDRDTSGLVCFAKNKEAHTLLSQSFAKHEPSKKYQAICSGCFTNSVGEIDFGIMENPQKRGRMIASQKGKEAFTSYEVKETFKSFSLVELSIKTGRTHQIRVHLQAIGHSILADPFYSSSNVFMLSSVKGKKFNKAKHSIENPLLSRTALHAYQLNFNHPIKNESIQLEAPLPKDMRAVLQQLRKWDAKK